ncbi:MAG: trypsin-like peptidase domain-containing protein [Deltaproteobacteria bacterium]|nr:trypsin-like peptidase domain-containing protein [Deltaproteobacteria bacterium]
MRLLLLSTFVLAQTWAAPALAEQLWQQRGAGSAPLAQVPDFAKLAKQVVPAVVSIQVEQKVRASRGPFEHYFWGPFGEVPREFRNRGLGSGFVIREDGLILTNNHVVENADSIEVAFETEGDGERKMRAKVLGTAPEYDIALLATEENAKAAVTYLGDSDSVNIGDWVMAVGNPFGLSHSVSVGIISAKERRDIMPSGRRGLYDFLQTDASINPGNSGGPLVNMRGEVIGINSAINAAGSGIGFAIPINMVKEMLPDLKSKGKFTRSWIGIRIQTMNQALAQSYGLGKSQGALVSEVIKDSPAAKGGVREGDVILEFDGKPVRSSSDLPLYASMAGVGKKVKLKLWREGSEKQVGVVLTEFPGEETAQVAPEGGGGGQLGITVADITPQIQQQLGLEVSRGVVIKEVMPGSAAAQEGLRPGDVILSFNGRAMGTAREFAQAFKELKSGAVMRLQILREGGRLFVAVPKP